MRSRLLALVLSVLGSLIGTLTLAVGPEPILLWPDGAPGATGEEEADKPSIRIYSPPAEKSNGAAVVICPGGGYAILAYDHEGAQVAQRLNEHGITGIVLQYRLAPRYRHPAPMQDVQRAMRYVRSKAEELKINPHRIGVMGFSAGGHLASTVSTHYDQGKADADDPIERVSCRPDFSVLCYAVISLQDAYAHKGSGNNLLGPDADAALWENLTNDRQVNAQSPPAFLFHTNEDQGVRVENALSYYSALVRHHVPAELHVYQNGPHGVGLADGEPGVGQWDDALITWLRTNGLLFNGDRCEVSGTILRDGQPLKWGSITFIPEDSNAPTAWAMVSGGKYTVPAVRGVPTGTVRVVVRNLGGLDPRPSIDATEILKTSGLVLDVHANEKNVFDLNLEAKAK